MKKFLAVVFWSVIAAAFIGPGTVTTAAAAGCGFGLALLWALTFSTLACFVLQEAAARLTVVGGRDLASALRQRYPGGLRGAAMLVLVLGAIVGGCAAYEAGNILGAVAGLQLVSPWSSWLLTLILGLVAGALLWDRPPRTVAHLLSILVAVMGVAFLWTAVALHPSWSTVLRSAIVPRRPSGSALLVLGLVGTTVVPYNLFMGSGIARGQELRDLRFGLAVAVGLGGLISMGVLIAGTVVSGSFSFSAAADVLANRLGPPGRSLFAIGLAAAGLSSAITAPLAAAVTARGLFTGSSEDPRWSSRSWRFRSIWIGVLVVGVGFGASGVHPIPVILLAQALNGVLLPVAATFLLLAVNDRRLVGVSGLNNAFSNICLVVVVAVSMVLGAGGVMRPIAVALGGGAPSAGAVSAVAAILLLALGIPVWRSIVRGRAGLD